MQSTKVDKAEQCTFAPDVLADPAPIPNGVLSHMLAEAIREVEEAEAAFQRARARHPSDVQNDILLSGIELCVIVANLPIINQIV